MSPQQEDNNRARQADFIVSVKYEYLFVIVLILQLCQECRLFLLDAVSLLFKGDLGTVQFHMQNRRISLGDVHLP